MRKSALRSTIVPMVISIIILCIVIMPPVSSLSVTNPKITAEVQPGKTYTYPMNVSIGPNDSEADFAVDIMGFGQSEDGSYNPIPTANDTSPYSARPFMSVDKPVFHLNSGGQQSVIITVRVPANIGTGGRYALVYIHSAPKAVSSSTAAIATAMVSPVLLSVQGGILTTTGSLTSVRADEAVTGKPVVILTTLHNTGNQHYYGAFVNVTVTDSTGKVAATASTQPSAYALIPGNDMTIKTSLPVLPPNTYTVKSDAKVGTTLLASKSSSFTVSTPSAVQTPTASKTKATGTTAPSGGTVIPETKTTTYTPLSIPIIVLALTVIVCIFSMRRRV